MTRLRITLLALAALPLVAAPPAGAQTKDPPTPAPPNERIIGGHAPTRAWPAQVSVQFTLPGQGTFQCGGTLVSGRWVATAGHCAEDGGNAIPPSAYTLRIGSANRGAGERFTVDRVELHSDFATNLGGAPENDVALLHLGRGASFEPLRLVRADETALWAPGVTATVIGWGKTCNDPTCGTVDDLQEGEVTIVSDSTCSEAYGGPLINPFNPDTMVCAGGGATDTCGGDSGGPLMVPRAGDFVLAGITSWGPRQCAQPGVPGVYTRIGEPALNGWIRARIPTVSLAASAGSIEAGRQVEFTATRTTPAGQPGEATFTWDLDGDGQYDDASGATASRVYTDAGTTAVRVQTTYPDGDRAVAREVVTVTPAPPASAPPDTSAPIAPAAPVARAAPLPSAATRPRVLAPSRMRFSTLRTAGVRARVTCARACSISARLTLDARTARRFGLTRGSSAVTIGRATARLDGAGTRTVRVRLTARARRALVRRLRSATIVLRTDVLSGTTRTRHARRIAVRR